MSKLSCMLILLHYLYFCSWVNVYIVLNLILGQSHIGKLLKEFEEPEPPVSRNIQAVTESQLPTQRSRWPSSMKKGYRPSSPAASHIAQKAQNIAHSAKSYRSVCPATSTKFPYQVTPVTSPVSVPFTPPLFLS